MLAVLRRPFGSALREPTAGDVYEGRLPEPKAPVRREPVVGADLLGGKGAAPQAWLARSSSALHATAREWAPWCEQCQAPPIDVFTQGNAEYLARQHDIVFHHGSWTCEALPAAEVAQLVAGAR